MLRQVGYLGCCFGCVAGALVILLFWLFFGFLCWWLLIEIAWET